MPTVARPGDRGIVDIGICFEQQGFTYIDHRQFPQTRPSRFPPFDLQIIIVSVADINRGAVIPRHGAVLF